MADSMDSVAVSPKSATITLLLCIFFGMFGIHRFYTGKIGTGILMLITLGGFGFWVLYDIVTISCCEYKDSEGRAVEFVKGRHQPLKVFFALLCMILAYIIIIFSLTFAVAMHATRGIANVMQAQLAAIKADNIAQAYEYTSQEFKDKTSLDQFKEFLSQYPIFKDYTSISYNMREIENNAGLIDATFYGPDDTKQRVRFLFIHRDDAWKIVGFSLIQDNNND